jgi:tetratricopeptide (TPR) repeat protein
LALLALPFAHAEEPGADWSLSFQEGLRLIQEDRPAEAIGHLQRAIEVNPDAPEPYAMIRLASGMRGRRVGEVGIERALIHLAHHHLQRDELDKAETVLKSLVQDRYANPEPHLLLQMLYAKRGRPEASKHAGKIFKGLLEALLATGDGKTPETAFLVQASRRNTFSSDTSSGAERGSSAWISRRQAACTTSSRWCAPMASARSTSM